MEIPSKSGIKETSTGDRHIPSSKRADGSVRKEIRVRPGYKPPEDVEVYKNKTADGWKNRGKGGVPGADFVSESKAKKPAKETTSNGNTVALKSGTKDVDQSAKTAGDAEEDGAAEPEKPIDPEEEKQKEARKLSKKLRQARELQQKKEKGDALLPEQFAKVIKINELMRQLDKLGFDADGQEKT